MPNRFVLSDYVTLPHPAVYQEPSSNTFSPEVLTELIKAIELKQSVEIFYQEFFGNETQFVVHPYQIREWRNRYYLIGKINKKVRLYNFALDRIAKTGAFGTQTFIENDTNIDEYYGKVFGITVLDDKEVEKVIFTLKLLPAEYLKTKPMHSTQRVIEETNEYVKFEITVSPNIELKKELLSFGSALVVESPENLRAELVSEIDLMYSAYQK